MPFFPLFSHLLKGARWFPRKICQIWSCVLLFHSSAFGQAQQKLPWFCDSFPAAELPRSFAPFIYIFFLSMLPQPAVNFRNVLQVYRCPTQPLRNILAVGKEFQWGFHAFIFVSFAALLSPAENLPSLISLLCLRDNVFLIILEPKCFRFVL